MKRYVYEIYNENGLLEARSEIDPDTEMYVIWLIQKLEERRCDDNGPSQATSGSPGIGGRRVNPNVS